MFSPASWSVKLLICLISFDSRNGLCWCDRHFKVGHKNRCGEVGRPFSSRPGSSSDEAAAHIHTTKAIMQSAGRVIGHEVNRCRQNTKSKSSISTELSTFLFFSPPVQRDLFRLLDPSKTSSGSHFQTKQSLKQVGYLALCLQPPCAQWWLVSLWPPKQHACTVRSQPTTQSY